MCLPLKLTASELPMTTPEDVGFSSQRLELISEFTRRNIEEKKHVGIVTMVARHGKIVHFDSVGKYGLDNDKPMGKDTLFRIYSMTKPIVTVAAMMLYEEGRFHLNDPVSKYLPEFKAQKVWVDGAVVPVQSEMTIEQLMSHTSGLTYDYDFLEEVDASYQEVDLRRARDLDQFVARLGSLPLRYEPGTRFHYSFSTDMLGAVIERISGQTLDDFLHERIFKPLEMDDTFFNVPDEKIERMASSHYWDAENETIALSRKEDVLPVQGVTLFSGGGGLVSTAMDYMVFCEMLRNGGSYNGVRILGPKTVWFMRINHLSDEVAAKVTPDQLYDGHLFGLGFAVVVEPGQDHVISSKGEYYWSGAADTKFWIDPVEDIVTILMTQLLSKPWETRYEMKVATYQALTDINED